MITTILDTRTFEDGLNTLYNSVTLMGNIEEVGHKHPKEL